MARKKRKSNIPARCHNTGMVNYVRALVGAYRGPGTERSAMRAGGRAMAASVNSCRGARRRKGR